MPGNCSQRKRFDFWTSAGKVKGRIYANICKSMREFLSQVLTIESSRNDSSRNNPVCSCYKRIPAFKNIEIKINAFTRLFVPLKLLLFTPATFRYPLRPVILA